MTEKKFKVQVISTDENLKKCKSLIPVSDICNLSVDNLIKLKEEGFKFRAMFFCKEEK